MTVKQLLTTMVSLPDRVAIIDTCRNITRSFRLDNPEEKKDLERYYYMRNVYRWILEKVEKQPTTIREIVDQAGSPYKNWKESMYIEVKGERKK